MKLSVLALFLGLAFPALSAGGEEGPYWYREPSPTSSTLVRIEFHPSGQGWAVGGVVLHYDRSAWRLVDPPKEQSSSFHALSVVGPEEFWTIDRTNRIYRFKNGRWTTYVLKQDIFLNDIDFCSPNLGYAVGNFGYVYTWDGREWKPVRSPALSIGQDSHLESVVVLAQDDVWITGFGTLQHFDGRNWMRLPPQAGPDHRYGAVQRFKNTVLVGGEPPLILVDGRWKPLIAGRLDRVVVQGSHIWALTQFGGNRSVAQDTFNGIVKVDLETGKSVPISLEHSGMTDLAASGETAWIVGDGGAIFKTRSERLPVFVDRTFESGTGVLDRGLRAFPADLDRDGTLDLFLYNAGSSRYLKGVAPGVFREYPLPAGRLTDGTSGCRAAMADLDGDGASDLVARQAGGKGKAAVYILMNLDAAGMAEIGKDRLGAEPEQDAPTDGSVTVGDLDGDGDLDIYCVRYCDLQNTGPIANLLWVNDGLGRFERRPLACRDGGRANGWSCGAALSDLDDDGLLDLFLADMWSADTVYFQGPPGVFHDRTPQSGLTGSSQTNTWALTGDIDGDGNMDILVGTLGDWGTSRLYKNDGQGHFLDVTTWSGLSFVISSRESEAELGDMDLDGDLDLLVAVATMVGPGPTNTTPRTTRLFLNDGSGRFSDVTGSMPFRGEAVGVVLEDLDNDGKLDIYLVKDGAPNQLFVNRTEGSGWLKVKLESPPPNRQGIGSRVRVLAADGKLLGVRETSWRHPVAHFGLGEHRVVDVEVRFPTAETVFRKGVSACASVTVRQVSRPSALLREAGFFLRHRVAWADRKREGAKLAAALGMLFITILLARRIGARYVIRRPLFPGAALALFLVFAFACSRMAAVSRTSDIAPLALMGSLCAVVLAVDCRITRKREARFIGPYEILGLIGSGGMGAVYRARETTVRESRVVALKVLKPDLMVRKDSRERFVREARLGAIIQHPGVVEVFGSGECEVREGNARMHTAYIVMEYVDGSSLGDILHREKTLPIWRCVQIVRSAAQALEAAHSKGVLHRDIKTDNILISKDGEVKLADFGIAKASYMTELTSMGTVVGTLVYMSPEQMLGETIDARSDLYSLGVVLYVLLTGRLPFDGDNPMTLLTAIFTSRLLRVRSLRPDVPEELDELVHRTLSPERDRRPSSAAELAAELSKILAAYPEAQSARRMTPTPKKLKTPLPAVVDPNRTTVRVEKKARPGAKKDS